MQNKRNTHNFTSRNADKRQARSGVDRSFKPSTRAESALDKGVVTVPGNNSDILITRRHLLYGALGVGVAAAAGVGIKTFTSKQAEKNAITTLAVPKASVTESTNLTEVEHAGQLYLHTQVELPYGTLLWASCDDYAALLLPTETGSPLTQVGLLSLSSGYNFTVLAQAVGADEGFEIYDVRATSEGMIWTEVDILEGVWRIYTAVLESGSPASITKVDEGTDDWETPSIAICGDVAFWQVLPVATGAKKTESSVLKRATVGSSAVDEVLSSQGRMCTPLYALDDGVVATPRVKTSGVYHQLTYVDAKTGEVKDSLVLPASMKPLEAGYGETGFSFSFEGIYSYGDGIANLGTYAPKTKAKGSEHSNVPWFHFARTPSAPPCWCGGYFIVKSTRSVCCVDLESNEYFLFNVQSGSDDYGDYLASTGIRDRIAIFANIDDTPIDGESRHCCLVRVYSC